MLCLAEKQGGFPCGKCTGCRVNKRRKWVARMLLEACLHPRVWFVTLTYEDLHLPPDRAVSKRELQLFVKRLRKALGVERLRYFGVGEYGERFGRPHYHLTVYGGDRADFPDLVKAAWSKGFVHVALATPDTMAYVAQYTLKKNTVATRKREDGRTPEFQLMSRRPGLASGCAAGLVAYLEQEFGRDEFWSKGGVTREFRSEGQVWPLDRFMRLKMEKAAGLEPAQFDGLTRYMLALRASMQKPVLTKDELREKRNEHLARARKLENRIRERAKL